MNRDRHAAQTTGASVVVAETRLAVVGKDQGASTDVVRLSDVEPSEIRWLWPGRLPLGKLVMLDGDPATSKSTLTLDLAARVTKGSPWPDMAPGIAPSAVLLMSAEDGIADTIHPRLRAAGADLSRVHALVSVPVVLDASIRHLAPSLPRDLDYLERVIVGNNVRLVVVDVLMAYLNAQVDSHRDQDVRGVLHLLSAMADRTGACVLLIRHLNKGGGSNALYRGGGSIGIVGAARAAYLVGRDPEDPDRRLLVVTKINVAAEPPALAYRLVADEAYGCARIEWEDRPVDGLRADQLLAGPVDPDEATARDECAAWLADLLRQNGGELAQGSVVRTGRIQGWSADQLKRAKKRAGVVSAKAGYTGGWVWRLLEPSDFTGPRGRIPRDPLPSPSSDDALLPWDSVKSAEAAEHAVPPDRRNTGGGRHGNEP